MVTCSFIIYMYLQWKPWNLFHTFLVYRKRHIVSHAITHFTVSHHYFKRCVDQLNTHAYMYNRLVTDLALEWTENRLSNTFANMAKQIRMVLIDLSGTLHIDNTVIPGAVEALIRWFSFMYFTKVFYIIVCTTMVSLTLRRF